MSGAPFDPPVRGAAHGRAQRGVATVMVALMVIGLLHLLWAVPEASLGGSSWLIGSAVFALLVASAFLMRSITTLDAAGVRQSGVLERTVSWSEIATARLSNVDVARLMGCGGVRCIALAGATPDQSACARVVADDAALRSVDR